MLAALVLPRPLLSTYHNYLNLRSTGRGVLVSGLCQFPYLFLLLHTTQLTHLHTFLPGSFCRFSGEDEFGKKFLDTYP